MEEIIINWAGKEDLKELIPIYKEAFKIHNIFEKSEQEILDYLEVKFNENRFLIAKENGKVIGGLLLKEVRTIKTHSLWKINHLAVSLDARDKGITTRLMDTVERAIKEVSETAKIEVFVSNNEKATLPFYKGLGFIEEGMLRSHYRYNENVFVLGKELSKLLRVKRNVEVHHSEPITAPIEQPNSGF